MRYLHLLCGRGAATNSEQRDESSTLDVRRSTGHPAGCTTCDNWEMALLSPSDQQTLRDMFADMTRTVTVVFFTQTIRLRDLR